MGFFDFLVPQEMRQQIDTRIRNSEAGRVFADNLCAMLNPGDEHYQWLMAGSHRMYRLEVFQNGVQFTRVEVTQARLRETGTYDIDQIGWGFGASGYQDLPNSTYVSVFRQFLIEQISANCPNVTIDNNGYIKLKETAKKGW